MIDLEYDPAADAAYIYLRRPSARGPFAVGHTVACAPRETSGHMINLDFDDDGRLIGIEVLDASRALPADLLTSSASSPPETG